VVFGTKEDMQRLDLPLRAGSVQALMLHYNFPPFARDLAARPREIGTVRSPSAPSANLLPPKRISVRHAPGLDILEVQRLLFDGHRLRRFASPLMDAGVPLKGALPAGIAMGPRRCEDHKYSILTDIAGAEDHYGRHGLQGRGTRSGITACRWTSRFSAFSIQMMRESPRPGEKGPFRILGHHGNRP